MKLICGPTGSGKTAHAVDVFLAALDRGDRAIFIAPSRPDARHFERHVLRRKKIITGGKITTFDGLCGQIRRNAGIEKPVISKVERNLLLRAVIDGTRDLAFTAKSAVFDGFVAALGKFITEMGEAEADPVSLAEACSGIVPQELNNDIFWLYKGYRDAVAEQGCLDEEGARSEARALLEADTELHGLDVAVIDGFWDFTPHEHKLIGQIDQSGAQVLLTLPFERGRIALQAVGRQFEKFEAEAAEISFLEAPENDPRPAALSRLDSRLFEDESSPVGADGAIRLLEGTASRGQAEMIAAEILALYRNKEARLDDIAVVNRSLGPDALAIVAAFDEFGIPHDFQGMMPLAETPVGRTALAALEFTAATLGFISGPAAALLRYLRSSLPVAAEATVDEFARRVRFYGVEGANDLLRIWKECGGRELTELTDMAVSAGTGVSELAADLYRIQQKLVADLTLKQCTDTGKSILNEVDLLCLKALDDICGEAVSVQKIRPIKGAAAINLLLDGVRTATIAGSAGDRRGCVRILDPHRILNQRFDVVFISGLLEKQFPAAPGESPFLSFELRRRLKEEKSVSIGSFGEDEQLQDERYLFHRALTRANRLIYLCYPHCDDEGKPTVKSLFVDEVLELFEALGEGYAKKRRITDLTFKLAEAPTRTHALQSLCLIAGMHSSPRGTCSPAIVSRLEEAFAPAASIPGERTLGHCLAGTAPGEFTVGDAAKKDFASKEMFSATALESYAACPYRFFLDRVVSPTSMDSRTYFLDRGTIAHCVLAKLGRALKRADVILWRADAGQKRMAHELIDQFLDEAIVSKGLKQDLDSQVLESTLRFYLHRYVEKQIVLESGLEPAHFEFPFGGMAVDGDCGGIGSADDALLIGGRFQVRGKIDRIDVQPDHSRALIIDYKTSKSASISTWGAWAGKGHLQIQLYMLAARELMGFEPVGGEYFTLADAGRQAIYLEDEQDLIGEARFGKAKNKVSREQLSQVLDDAEATAVRAAEGIIAARFISDPRDAKVCKQCGFTSVCRNRGERHGQ